jgi:hypothetical protein
MSGIKIKNSIPLIVSNVASDVEYELNRCFINNIK